jgi:hypothetical protein
MKRYTIASVLLALAALMLLGYPQQFSLNGGAAGQKRPPRNPVTAAPSGPGAKDYSKFSHYTKEHTEDCKTCHKLPTANWQKVRAFPDVADFPGHDACVRCHRAQFFKGAQPAICSVCHTKTSPKDSARLAFRNPSRLQQFTIKFPHDKHQDVIAALPARRGSAFRSSSLMKSAHAAADEPKHYNNCEICHAANPTPAAPKAGWPDGYAPPAGTFKDAPGNHASCFNCHWGHQEPTKDNCKGCHVPAATPYLPLTSPKRFSLKFQHDGGGTGASKAHPAECTTCHINITKAATLEGLKADVPIYPSCAQASCHGKGKALEDEMVKFSKGNFKCTKCHASDVGGKKPPVSHDQALLGQ